MSNTNDKDAPKAVDSEPEANAEANAEAETESQAEAETESQAEAASEDSSPEAGEESQQEPAASASSAQDEGDRPHGDDDDHEGTELYGLLAEYKTTGELIAAAAKVRDAGYQKWDCYSPFPVHGIDPAMGIKRTVLPWIVFVIGLCGLGGGLLLQWWTNAFNWPWIVSGKPFFSLPANIPITFESTVLLSVFAAFFGMWGLNKLPQLWHPFFKKNRFRKVTDDGFFIGIEAEDKAFQRGKTQALLEETGAVAVETCYINKDPARWAMPRPLIGFIIVTGVLGLVPFALVAKARATKTDVPRIHVFSDMDFQPKAKAQTASDLFADSRSNRQQVTGTVARGELRADDHFYRGIRNGAWATSFPPQFEISMRAVENGRLRYSIYCQPCHGTSGKGNGMIHQRSLRVPVRGWVQPTNLHTGYVIQQPHGQLFNTISNGIRSMPGYSAQISEVDRWAIVLYMRALQRSQNANLSDVPVEERSRIQ